ncbi:MAG: hypothetical protein U0270_16050 [Labilithrix sp.]
MRRSFRITSLSLVAVGLAACSLVNSLDEVKPADDGKFTGDTRPTPTVTVEDAGFGPTGPAVDAGQDALTAETFSPIIVGGEASIVGSGALTPVLTVLDAKTGQERGKRETMWVAGIGHDDARDLWYIFEAKNYLVTAPTETVTVHVRRLDTKTGAWTELSTYDGPPLVYYDALAVTNERISYVAHPASGGTKNRLITLNTSNVNATPVLNSDIELDDGLPRGMIATPSLTGPGGNLSLVYLGRSGTPDCEALDGGGTRCKVKIRRVLIPNGGVPQLAASATAFGGMASTGAPGYGSVTCGGAPDDVIVMPGIGRNDQGVSQNGVQTVTTLDYSVTTETDSFAFNMSTTVGPPTILRRVAIDNQRRIVFVVEANNDTALYAVPLRPNPAAPVGTAQKINLRHSGQSVYYDPASETAFAPFNQGEGKTFSAIKVSGGKDGAAIALKERLSKTETGGDWDPPTDLRPNILGLRGLTTQCP